MRKPHAHFMQANARTTMPTACIVLDTETTLVKLNSRKTKHILRLGCALSFDASRPDPAGPPGWVHFHQAGDFWDFVRKHVKQHNKLTMFGHNVFYDLVAVDAFHTLAQDGWEISFAYEYGRTQIFTWRKSGRTIVALSSTNFLAGGVEELGHYVDLPKLQVNLSTVGDEELMTYCHRDAEIVMRALLQYMQFITSNDLGQFRPTLAGQALGAYRHRFMQQRIFCHHNDEISELEELGYFGGRCEVFRVGHFDSGPFYALDVNSLYLSIMHDCYLPAAVTRITHGMTIESLIRGLRFQGCIADVTLNIVEPAFPVRYDTRNIYPTGEFRSVLTTPEIVFALGHGMVKAVHNVAFYKMRKLFTKYSEWIQNSRLTYRENGNVLYEQLCKMMGNSLYGKLGQHSIESTVMRDCPYDDVWIEYVKNLETGEQYRIQALGGHVWKLRRAGLAYNSFTAIPAHVTAYGRLKMFRLIEAAGRRNVFYCDTDGLIVNQDGYLALRSHIHPEQPGSLKIVKVADALTVNARKDYSLGDAVRHKGVPSSAVALGDDDFEYQVWPGLATMLRNRDLRSFYTYSCVKHLDRECLDGSIDRDGYVTPFERNDLLPENLDENIPFTDPPTS